MKPVLIVVFSFLILFGCSQGNTKGDLNENIQELSNSSIDSVDTSVNHSIDVDLMDVRFPISDDRFIKKLVTEGNPFDVTFLSGLSQISEGIELEYASVKLSGFFSEKIDSVSQYVTFNVDVRNEGDSSLGMHNFFGKFNVLNNESESFPLLDYGERSTYQMTRDLAPGEQISFVMSNVVNTSDKISYITLVDDLLSESVNLYVMYN